MNYLKQISKWIFLRFEKKNVSFSLCCYEIAGSRQEVVYEIVAVTSNASVMLIDFLSHAAVDLILLFTRSIYTPSLHKYKTRIHE